MYSLKFNFGLCMFLVLLFNHCFIYGIQISNIIYYPGFRADFIGSQLSNVTNALVFPFGQGATTPVNIISKNDTLVSVKFDDTQVYQGLAGLFDQSGTTSKFGWNPLLLINVTSVGSSGGIITVNGWYISPSTVANNTLTFTNHSLSLKEIGTGGLNKSQSYYLLSPDQSTFIGTNLPVTVMVREIGFSSLNFSFLPPSISKVSTDNYMLNVSGDSFGSDKSHVVLIVNNQTYTNSNFNSFIKHRNIVLDITSLYPNTIKNGKNYLVVNVTNFQSTLYTNFTIAPIIHSVTNSSIHGGVITITGNYLSMVNVTNVTVTVGNSKCQQPTSLDGNNKITCMVDPKGEQSDSLPVIIIFDQYSSNDNSQQTTYFNYDQPASSANQLIPKIIQLITLITLYHLIF